jgi:hypothetical protein
VLADVDVSPWSNTVCVDPAAEAAKPNIRVWGVNGPEEQEWAQVKAS